MVYRAIGAVDDARAIKTLLSRHLEARSLVAGLHQRINRRHYLSLAEVVSSKQVRAVFDEFDAIAHAMLEMSADDLTALSDYMESAFASQMLAIRKGGVHRRRIERIFGYPEEVLDKEPFPAFFSVWEKRIVESGYVPNTRAITAEDNKLILNPVTPRSPFLPHSRSLAEDSLANRLRRILQQDYDDRILQLNKYGRVSRTTYAGRLGVQKAKLTSHRATFEYFEEKLGELSSKCVAALPKVKQWFLDEVSRGTLNIIDGKVVVSDIIDLADVSPSTWYNTAAATDLLEWMNSQINRLGYVPRKNTDPALRLLKVLPLASLNADGLTVNRTRLRKTGVLSSRELRLLSVRDAIDAFERKLRTEAESNPLKVVID